MSNWERKAEIRPEHYQDLDNEDFVLVDWHKESYVDIMSVEDLCGLGFGNEDGLGHTAGFTLYNVEVSPASGRAEHDALVEWAEGRDIEPFLKWLEDEVVIDEDQR